MEQVGDRLRSIGFAVRATALRAFKGAATAGAWLCSKNPGELFTRMAVAWKLKILWKGLVTFWSGLKIAAINGLWILIFVVISIIVIKALRERAIAVDPIAVPKSLADAGYTPDVASHRLRDALKRYGQDSPPQTTQMTKTPLEVATIQVKGDLPDIVLPTIGLSIDSIAAYVRTFGSNNRHKSISGEITVAQDKLWLRLRRNGTEFYRSDVGVDPANTDDLFAMAASKVYEATEPYVVAEKSVISNPVYARNLAQQIIDKGPEEDPENIAPSHVLIGTTLLNEGNFKEAADECNKALELDSHLWAAHEILGKALLAQGRTTEGEEEYQKAVIEIRGAIDRDPHNVTLHNSFGGMLSDHGDVETAIKEFKSAIALNPHYALAYERLGNVLFNSGKYTEAVVEYLNAIAREPRYSSYLGLAEAYFQLRQTALADDAAGKAIAALRKFTAADGQDAMAYSYLGNALDWAGNFHDAIYYYDRALSINPNFTSTLVNRGTHLLAAGDFDAAIPNLVRAVKQWPSYPYLTLWLYLARAHSQDPGARVEFETNAAKIDPDAWPYPIIQLFLQQKNPAETRDAAGTPDEICEAQFYVAEWHQLQTGGASEMDQHRAAAKNSLQAAANTCSHTFVEWVGAQIELERLGR
jgi:tetratricopeptide (TPR) repeat protein